MTKDYMMELLKRGESTSLDWKREFPHGMLKGRSDPYWDQGRAEVLKDIIAIANAEENGSGYLVSDFSVSLSGEPTTQRNRMRPMKVFEI